MRPTRHALLLATTAALALGVLGPVGPAGAAGTAAGAPAAAGRGATTAKAGAVTIGQTGPAVVCSTAVPAGVLLTTLGAGGATYTAPSSGVLTSFAHQANNVNGQVRAIVFGPGPSASQRTVVAKSPKFTVTRSTLNAFAVRLPIAAGQEVGLGYTASGMACATTGVTGDVTSVATAFDPDLTSTFTPAGALSPGSPRPNISAVLEPDVDRDGFGDVTQDACPRSALTQVACPDPETTITKKPKRVRGNPKVKIKFTSTVPGSTFKCSVDFRKFRRCTSPFRKKLGVGKHVIRVLAISPAGIKDPKPAKVRVRITR